MCSTPSGRSSTSSPDLATPEKVQDSLREILGDPTLELYWWDWERERYVDVLEREVVEDAEGRIVTLVEYESRKVGAIAHDARLLERPEFLETLVPTMRIAMERDRLHRDLVRKLDELKASRARIVKVADAERRRLERNLHDGAQQSLTIALLKLRHLEQQLTRRRPTSGSASRATARHWSSRCETTASAAPWSTPGRSRLASAA